MLKLVHLAVTEQEPARTHAREHLALERRGAPTRVSEAPEPARSVRPLLAIGQRLGTRYRITGFLGKGGMGAVYRAFDTVLDEEVALKVVRGDLESLREEVRLAQHVTHRNVCRTYDIELIEGQHFVKMEYIAGETLADRLARTGPLPIAYAVGVARSIADGLAAAHARGIVHRDLKPGNVMLDGDRVVLMDFGLAQHEGASDLSGTPGYMSPEQLAGDAVDPRSDLFALGCLVFEMVTGVPPFGTGTIADVVVRLETAPDLHALRRGVPCWLAGAVSALLAVDPAARTRGLKALARGGWSSWLAIAAVAAVVAVATGWAHVRSPAAPWEPIVRDLPAYDENAAEPSHSPDGRSFVFSSDRGHRDLWAVYVSEPGREPRQVSPANTLCVGARWTRDGRAVLMSCLRDRERRIVRHALDGGADRDLGPGWSVDDCGDALAVVVSRPAGAALVQRDRDGDTELVALPDIAFARCDRSGRRVVTLEGPIGHPGFGGDLLVVDRTSAPLRGAARPGGAGAFDRTSAPLRDAARPAGAGDFDRTSAPLRDAERPAGAGDFDRTSAPLRGAALPGGAGDFDRTSAPLRGAALPGGAGDFDRHGGARRLTHTGNVIDATFAPDGASIVFSMQRGSMSSMFDVSVDGGDPHELTPHEQYASTPDISPDGASVIFDRDRTTIPLFELTPRGPVQQTFRFERLSHVVAAPNGRALVAANQQQSGLSIVVVELSDFTERPLTGGEALYVSHDDEVVFRAPDDAGRLLSIPLRGGPITVLATMPAPIVDAADGPDGRHVELDRDGRSEAWVVGLDGQRAQEGVAGLVIPAPAGGWRVVRIANGVQVTLRFVAPGRPLSAPAFERAAAWGQPAWIDDRVFAYCELRTCHRVDVTTGRDVETTEIDPPGARPITVGSGGTRWFTTSYVGHVTRHVITNFADRWSAR